VYGSMMHRLLASDYGDMVSSHKSKKSLSAWSLATKLTGSHISLSSKQKKPPEDTHGEIMCIMCKSL